MRKFGTVASGENPRSNDVTDRMEDRGVEYAESASGMAPVATSFYIKKSVGKMVMNEKI